MQIAFIAAFDPRQQADRADGMFVHRIVVVHIELHLRDHTPEIQNEAAEHARLAHPAQHRFGVTAAGQDIHEQLVGTRITAHRRIDQPGIAMRLAHGFGMDFHAFAVGHMEQFDQADRVFCKEVVAVRRHFVGNHRKGTDLAPGAAPCAQLGKKAQPLRRPLVIQLGQKYAGQRSHLPRVEKEHLHEAFDRALARPVGKIHPQRHFALQIKRQPVFGPVGDHVQVAAHRPEKVFGPAERAVFQPGQQADVDQFRRIAHLVDIFADPVQRVQIAQAALALFHIGFDDIAAVAQAFVPLVAFGQLLFDKLALGAGGNIDPEPTLRLFVQGPVAPHIAAFQQRGADRHVGFGLAHHFIERPARMADLQPQIPQEIQDRLDHLFAP